MWGFGVKSIGWYEFESNRVKTLSKHLRPYKNGEFKYQKCAGTLEIKPVQFFSIMARTAVLKKPMWYEEKFEAASFWLRYSKLFSGGKDTRLRSGAVSYYKDADRTYWASRLGETYGYLEMERRGYTYIDHMETAIKRIAPYTTFKGGADYFCLGAGQLNDAIVELKGHIVNPHAKKKTTIKNQLSGALSQCATISGVLPKGHKANTFAVATYIREAGDKSNEPSLIAVSDPEVSGDDNLNITTKELYESVLRGNYGTLIQMMGLNDIGWHILNYSEPKIIEDINLTLLTYNNETYVFLTDSFKNTSSPIEYNIIFGLQKDLFREIVNAVIKGQSLYGLDIVQLMDGSKQDQGYYGEYNDSNNNLMDSDIHIYNDKAIAITEFRLCQIYENKDELSSTQTIDFIDLLFYN